MVSGGLNDPPPLANVVDSPIIEALVLFPNIEQEGIPQQPSLKGDNQYKLS